MARKTAGEKFDANDAARAACEFTQRLRVLEGYDNASDFIMAFCGEDFDFIRSQWPDAPAAVFGAESSAERMAEQAEHAADCQQDR